MSQRRQARAIHAGAIYRKVEAQLTAEQAEQTAVDVAQDIRTLALFLKEQGLGKDYDNAMAVAQRFEQMANALAKQQLSN